jgi:hypothetical protein
VVTDAQTVFTVVVYLGSLLDDDDINVLYELSCSVRPDVSLTSADVRPQVT